MYQRSDCHAAALVKRPLSSRLPLAPTFKPEAAAARQLGHASSQVTTSAYEHQLDDGLLDDALTVFGDDPRIAQGSEAEREQGANPLN